MFLSLSNHNPGWNVGSYCPSIPQRGLAGVHVAVLCKRYRTLGALLARGVVNINQPSTNVSLYYVNPSEYYVGGWFLFIKS